MYTSLRDYDRAIADLDAAIKLDAKYFQAFNQRGKVYALKGNHNRAITDFTEAIRFNAKYVEAHNNRGLSYKALGRKAEAIADFRKAQSIDPSDQVSREQLRLLGA